MSCTLRSVLPFLWIGACLSPVCKSQINFAPAVKYHLGDNVSFAGGQPLVTADFNGDGRPDVAIPASDGVLIVLNNGDGSFGSPIPYSIGTAGGIGGIATGDFNGDGFPDLALITFSPSYVRVYLNDGRGNLTKPIDYSLPFQGGTLGCNCQDGFVAVADFDGDGILDIAAQVWGGIQMFHGQGNGGFTATDTFSSPGGIMYKADLNGDGLPDLYFANEAYTAAITVLLNKGAGVFAPPAVYGTQAHVIPPVIPVDVKGNGKPDLFGGNDYSYIDIKLMEDFPNDGAGGFGPPIPLSTGVGFFTTLLAAADFDNDGHVDLVALGEVGSGNPDIDAHNLVVFPNEGHSLGAPFSLVSGIPGESAGAAIVAPADVDGDGLTDFLLLGYNNASLDLYVIRNITRTSVQPLAVDRVLPDSGGNIGTISSVEIVGTGFPPNAGIKLVGPGGDIIPTSVKESAAGNLITVNFDLKGVMPGSYALVITDRKGNVLLTKDAAFAIVKGGAPDIWVDFVGLGKLRAGAQQTYYLVVGNRGNVDSGIVRAWVAFPNYVSGNEFAQLPSAAGQMDGYTFAAFDVSVIANSQAVIPIQLSAPDSSVYAHKVFQIEAWRDVK